MISIIFYLNCMVKANALLMYTCFAIWLNMFDYGVHFGHSQLLVLEARMDASNTYSMGTLIFFINCSLIQHTLQHVQTRLAKFDNERTMQYINVSPCL